MPNDAASPREDHDRRFKTAVKQFFPLFLALALPELNGQFVFASLEWIDKEAFPKRSRLRRREMDLVAKIQIINDKGETTERLIWIFLLVEIESANSLTRLRNQIFDYYALLVSEFGPTVVPVALLLNVGLDGIGWDKIVHIPTPALRPPCMLEYKYVGLPALNAEDYVESDNIFATALTALMKASNERKAELMAKALNRIGQSASTTEDERSILGEIVDAYMDLTPEQDAEFQSLLDRPEFEESRTMTTRWHRQGIAEGEAKGEAKGKAKGKAESLLLIGEKKFGRKPSKAVREKIMGTTDVAVLEMWLGRVLDVEKWNDLIA